MSNHESLMNDKLYWTTSGLGFRFWLEYWTTFLKEVVQYSNPKCKCILTVPLSQKRSARVQVEI